MFVKISMKLPFTLKNKRQFFFVIEFKNFFYPRKRDFWFLKKNPQTNFFLWIVALIQNFKIQKCTFLGVKYFFIIFLCFSFWNNRGTYGLLVFFLLLSFKNFFIPEKEIFGFWRKIHKLIFFFELWLWFKISKFKNAHFWGSNIFFIIFLCFSFWNNRGTNGLLVSIFENVGKKGIGLRKR